jgi:hypothetical protein
LIYLHIYGIVYLINQIKPSVPDTQCRPCRNRLADCPFTTPRKVVITMSAANGAGATWSHPTLYRGPSAGNNDVAHLALTFHAVEPIAPGAPDHLCVRILTDLRHHCTKLEVTGLPLRDGYRTQIRLILTAAGHEYHPQEGTDKAVLSFKINSPAEIPADQIRFHLELIQLPAETVTAEVLPAQAVNIPRPTRTVDVPSHVV